MIPMQPPLAPAAGRSRTLLAAVLASTVACSLGCRSTLPGAPPSPISKHPLVSTTYYTPAEKITRLLVIAPSAARFDSKTELTGPSATRLAEINAFADAFVKALPTALPAKLLSGPVSGRVMAVPTSVAAVKVQAPNFPFHLKIDPYSTQYGAAGARLNLELVLREATSDRIVWKAIAEVLVDPSGKAEESAAEFGERIRARLARDGLL
jgi:hypothetical protein